MFFQGRGKVYLAVVAAGIAGAFDREICPDTFSIDLATETGEHINKCGPQDVPDATWAKSSSGTLNFSFANVEDRNYALAVLGNVVAPVTGSVVDEELPQDLIAGTRWFLGTNLPEGRHRGITNLVGSGLGVLDTDYTLNAATGMITMLTDQSGSPAPTVSYDFSDPQFVSMLTAASLEYAAMFENINKMEANDPGSVELYRVKFNPASSMDYLSDDLQIPQITGKVLADTTKESDGDLGQFGRRVL